MSNNEHCPVAATLELIGGKYKALILWHLAENDLRFSQLRDVITGATAKMLTQQLRELEAHALVHREVFPVVPPQGGLFPDGAGQEPDAHPHRHAGLGQRLSEKQTPGTQLRHDVQ